MKLYVNGAEKEITMRAWNGENWGPDFFGDAEDGYYNGQEVTEEEYRDIVEAWGDAVEEYNSKRPSELMGDYDEEFALELMLDYEEA